MSGFQGWDAVASDLRNRAADEPSTHLNNGQRAALSAIAARIPRNGVLIADEVGMGKTRIAVELIHSVQQCGGRVAVLIPPGLGYQWQEELRQGNVVAPGVLRSMWSFLEAWKSNEDALLPWGDYPILLLSHRLSSWAPRAKGEAWRWAILPAVVARLIKQDTNRFPNYASDEKLDDDWVIECANWIGAALDRPVDPTLSALRSELVQDDIRDHHTLLSGTSYQRDGKWRIWLERIVGVGLGTFDLIVIDEAHKSRGDESGLTRMLKNTVLCHPDARRLALTATPVELDELQWLGTLDRAGARAGDKAQLTTAIKNYATAARRLRDRWRTDSEGRTIYSAAASAFKLALDPYLVRRDKREDEAVRSFVQHSGSTAIDGYRKEHEISIEVDTLTLGWRRTVLASESLSVVCAGLEQTQLQRLRLTVANGHGLSAILDDEALANPILLESSDDKPTMAKRIERAEWWRKVLANALVGNERSLFNHPSILAACEAIEAATDGGEKILVFGRYTGPMRAMTALLNAREMLKRVRDGRTWPQSKVHGERDEPIERSDWPAVEAAAKQLQMLDRLANLDETLADGYRELENRRVRFRAGLLRALGESLALKSLARKAYEQLTRKQNEIGEDESSILALVARAIGELTGAFESDNALPSDQDIALAFEDVLGAVTDRDDAETEEDQQSDGEAYWTRVKARLEEEYQTSQGTFARMMYGGTTLPSRRMMQASFNRPGSFLRVLVAQSAVGREGLNLHKACRIVVNLHPEWNPAVAEQQIGRVDRVGSLWAQQCAKAIDGGKTGDDLPRIEIRPVIFRGTYDEHHWEVLRERWDDLRSQLHGIVVPTRHAGSIPDEKAILDELAGYAPSFSPTALFMTQQSAVSGYDAARRKSFSESGDGK